MKKGISSHYCIIGFGVQGRDYRGIMFSCSLLITSYLKGFRLRRAVDSGVKGWGRGFRLWGLRLRVQVWAL